MWDVVRFAEQMVYDALVIENVVEATKWVLWPAWLQALTDLGYQHRVLSHNSMHHGVPQSRDRIYVVFWRKGLKPDLEMELTAWCRRCSGFRSVRQAWKNGRAVGRYRLQWVWACIACGATCEPSTRSAADIIDWQLPCPRIGERRRPLAKATRARILAGLQRYGWAPVITAGAGHTYETTPGNRSRPVTQPLPVQGTTAQHALAQPPAFLVQTHHGGGDGSRVRGLDEPTWTVTASDDRPAFVDPPAYVLRRFTPRGSTGQMLTPVEQALPTCGASGSHGLVVPLRRHGHPQPADRPIPTVTAGGNHHALVITNDHLNRARPVDEALSTITTGNRHGLLMRNNGGGAEMVTPIEEPARTVTTKGHQSLLVPADMAAVDEVAQDLLDRIVDDCGFRMLEPHEIELAMAFPAGYIPDDLTKRDRVKLAGNAVTPPVMTWITGRVLQALEAAAA
jgi:DNA (cytosine-5)-methyltransferase 1